MQCSYIRLNTSINLLKESALPSSDVPYILTIQQNGVNYEFLIRYKNSKKALIFGNGAYDKIQSLPLFQRHSWIDDLDHTVIYYNDPTLYLGDISIGWCCGSKDDHYLINIAEILKIIIDKFSVDNNKVVFYGSSAGGFTSMMLSTLFKGSTALVNNPQVYVNKFSEAHFLKLCEICFPNESPKDVLSKYEDRLNLPAFIKKQNYFPRIKYLQNAYCHYDMKTQCVPFISDLETSDKFLFSPERIDFIFYFDRNLGHNPLSKEKSLYYINEALKDIE